MKKTILTAILAMAVSFPVFADNSTDINNRKAVIHSNYENERNAENQDYSADVANAKRYYQNDPKKLDNVLKELQIKHDNKIEDLNSSEKLDMLKMDEQNNS